MARDRPVKAKVKAMLPANLFGRALLILLVPIIVLQLLMAHIFYDRHWDSVVRNMAATGSSEAALLLREYRRLTQQTEAAEAQTEIARMGKTLGIAVAFSPDAALPPQARTPRYLREFERSLRHRLDVPLVLALHGGDRIRVVLALENEQMQLEFGRKRLASSTTSIFLGWMLGSSVLLMLIAVLFLRNQVRPIVQLARASEQFGLGQDVQNFSPRGASEIRRAGRAFLTMADRIRRQVQSRTEMLAGISHDLRTPLTRMKLEIEMGKIDSATREALTADIDEMRRMIDEYLDFARSDKAEPMEPMDIGALMNHLCQQYQRQGGQVHAVELASVVLMVRPQAMRRALVNLVENALRYGGGVAELRLEQTMGFVRIRVRDHGPGIPEAEHETVFKPFTRLEPSRNLATGGVGLGLSIARDIAQSHGGEISLENQRDASGAITGLEVTLRLPREVQKLT